MHGAFGMPATFSIQGAVERARGQVFAFKVPTVNADLSVSLQTGGAAIRERGVAWDPAGVEGEAGPEGALVEGVGWASATRVERSSASGGSSERSASLAS